jgi:HEAT repeat protein
MPAGEYYLRAGMLNPEHFVVTLARAVELFRTMPDAVPEQKAALRALVALSKLGAVTLRIDGAALQVADSPVPTSLPNVPALLVQLRNHTVSSIEIEKEAAPADLLALLRGLASHLSDGGLMLHGGTVRVVSGAQNDGVDAVSASVDVPMVESDQEQAPEAGDEVQFFSGLRGEDGKVESLESALGALDASPYEGDILGRLSAVAAAITDQIQLDRVERGLPALAALVDLESNAPDEASRRAYGITLIRLLEGDILEAAADMLLDHRFQGGAEQVLQRAGYPAFEILHKRLDAAVDVDEARIYSDVLRPLVDDVRPLLPLLQHQRWPIAESVAKILGDLALKETVPALADAVEHGDPRVRRAAVMALCRIGDRSAVEHMLRAVASDDEVSRSAVIAGVEGQKSSALAMPILKVAEEDSTRPEVRRDCYLALGRIGTPEAVQALVSAAEPGGRIVGRKSIEQRVAAIDGLRHADDPRILDRLEQLTEDREKGVRAAAELALVEVKERLGIPMVE